MTLEDYKYHYKEALELIEKVDPNYFSYGIYLEEQEGFKILMDNPKFVIYQAPRELDGKSCKLTLKNGDKVDAYKWEVVGPFLVYISKENPELLITHLRPNRFLYFADKQRIEIYDKSNIENFTGLGLLS